MLEDTDLDHAAVDPGSKGFIPTDVRRAANCPDGIRRRPCCGNACGQEPGIFPPRSVTSLLKDSSE